MLASNTQKLSASSKSICQSFCALCIPRPPCTVDHSEVYNTQTQSIAASQTSQFRYKLLLLIVTSGLTVFCKQNLLICHYTVSLQTIKVVSVLLDKMYTCSQLEILCVVHNVYQKQVWVDMEKYCLGRFTEHM